MPEGSRKRLVISEDDLKEPAPPGAPASADAPMNAAQSQAAQSFPTVEGIGATPRSVSPSSRAPAGSAQFLQTVQGRNLVAAVCGIAVGWAICEITGFGLWSATSSFGQDVAAGAYTGGVGLFFALVYSGWEHILSRNWQGVRIAARRAAPWGFGLAFAAGFVAQIVYRHFVLQILRGLNTFTDLEHISSNTKLYLTRALAWGLFGLGMGVAVAGGIKGREKLINGLIGGGIGGALGGLVFHWASFNISSDTWARFVGLIVIGIAIGAAIGFVETARRDAWMQITGGPMAGKEFILYGNEYTLGSSPKCDMTLIKDSTIQPFHAAVRTVTEGRRQSRILQAYDNCAIAVNGAPVAHHRLRSGDTISLGQMAILYSERSVTS